MAIDFGFGLLEGPPFDDEGRWMREFDAVLPQVAGHFDSLWMTDHFFWPRNSTYEAWTTLAFIAGKWPQFKVGPMVLGQSYRNPALLAQMAATLQSMSGGRFIMGIGAGWKEDEYRAFGYPYPTPGARIKQLEETVEIMKRLWTESDPVTYQGKYYQVENASISPRPNPVPPIMIGGAGEKTLMVTARHADWWNLSDSNLERYTDRLNVLRQHCATIGRDFSTLRLTWYGRLMVGRTEAEAEARGIGRWSRVNGFMGTPDQVVEQMKAFVDVGVTYFMFEVRDMTNPDVIKMTTEEILPRVRAMG